MNEQLLPSREAFAAMQAAAVSVHHAADKWSNLADQILLWMPFVVFVWLALYAVSVFSKKES